MKKRIASLLALALVLTLLVPALATANELSVEEKYSTLEDLKIFEGVDEDGTPALDENMNRAQAATILFRLLELVDPEVEEATYSDVPVDHWANAAVEAATQIEYAPGKTIIDGRGDGTFDPSAEVTLQELAALLVRALIYKGADIELDENAEVAGEVKDWARGYVAAAVAHGILPASDDYTVAATRGALASATYETVVAIGEKDVKLAVVQAEAVSAQVVEVTFNNGETLEVQLDEALEANVATAVDFEYRGYSYQVEVTYVVDVIEIEKVEAAKANVLKVTFNRDLSAEEQAAANFVVTLNGANIQLKSEVKFEGNSALLQRVNEASLLAGTYNVSVQGLTEAALTASGNVEAERAVGLEIVTDYVENKNNQEVAVNVLNQYGDAMTAHGQLQFNYFNVTNAARAVTNVGNADPATTGTANFTNTLVGDRIAVSVALLGTGLSASKQIEVVLVTPQSVTLGDVQLPDGKVRLDINTAGVIIPMSIVGTHGPLKAPAEANIPSTGKFIFDNGMYIQHSGGAIANLAINNDGNLVVNTSNTPGNAYITISIPATGQVVQKTLTVADKARLHSLTISNPDAIVRDGQTVKIPFAMTDQFGQEFKVDQLGGDLLDDLTVVSTSNPSVATVDWNDSNELELTAKGEGHVTIYVNVLGTGSTSQINVQVQPAPVATNIVVHGSPQTSLAHGQLIAGDADNGLKFKVVDQDGNVASLAGIGNEGIKVLVTLSNENATVNGAEDAVVSAANEDGIFEIDIEAANNTGSVTVTAQLFYDQNGDDEFNAGDTLLPGSASITYTVSPRAFTSGVVAAGGDGVTANDAGGVAYKAVGGTVELTYTTQDQAGDEFDVTANTTVTWTVTNNTSENITIGDVTIAKGATGTATATVTAGTNSVTSTFKVPGAGKVTFEAKAGNANAVTYTVYATDVSLANKTQYAGTVVAFDKEDKEEPVNWIVLDTAIGFVVVADYTAGDDSYTVNGSTATEDQFEANLTVGDHLVVSRDEHGNTTSNLTNN